jgi:hypothetical protein
MFSDPDRRLPAIPTSIVICLSFLLVDQNASRILTHAGGLAGCRRRT